MGALAAALPGAIVSDNHRLKQLLKRTFKMLYNPAWEAPVKAKPHPVSLEGLITWLEKQNPDTRYNYTSNSDCLLSRYFRSCGYLRVRCYLDGFHYSLIFFKNIPEEMNYVAGDYGWTYGAALDRARRVVSGD